MTYSCESIGGIHSGMNEICAYLEIHCIEFFRLISNDKRNSMRKNLFRVILRTGLVVVENPFIQL